MASFHSSTSLVKKKREKRSGRRFEGTKKSRAGGRASAQSGASAADKAAAAREKRALQRKMREEEEERKKRERAAATSIQGMFRATVARMEVRKRASLLWENGQQSERTAALLLLMLQLDREEGSRRARCQQFCREYGDPFTMNTHSNIALRLAEFLLKFSHDSLPNFPMAPVISKLVCHALAGSDRDSANLPLAALQRIVVALFAFAEQGRMHLLQLGERLLPALRAIMRCVPNAWPSRLASVLFHIELTAAEDICEPIRQSFRQESMAFTTLLGDIKKVMHAFSPLQRLRCLLNLVLMNTVLGDACSTPEYSQACGHLLLGAPGSIFGAPAESSHALAALYAPFRVSRDRDGAEKTETNGEKAFHVSDNNDDDDDDDDNDDDDDDDDDADDVNGVDLEDIGQDDKILRDYARAMFRFTDRDEGDMRNDHHIKCTSLTQTLRIFSHDGSADDRSLECVDAIPVAAFFARWATQAIIDDSSCDLSLLGPEATAAIQYWLGDGEDSLPRYIHLWKDLRRKCSISSDWLRLSSEPVHLLSEFGVSIAETVPPVVFIFTFCLYTHLCQLPDSDFYGSKAPLPLATEMSHAVLFLQALTSRLSSRNSEGHSSVNSDQLFAPFLRLVCHRLLGHLLNRHDRKPFIRNTTSLDPEIAAYLEDERQLKLKQEEEYHASLRLDAEREEKRRLERIEMARMEEEAKKKREEWKSKKLNYADMLGRAAERAQVAAAGSDLCRVRIQFRNGTTSERQFLAESDVSMLWKWAAVELDEEAYREITLVSQYPRKVLTESCNAGQSFRDCGLFPRIKLMEK